VKVKNVSSQGDLEVPAIGRVVKAGETVEVPDVIGSALLEQSDVWTAPVKETKE
jgi:hypothetical protein